MVGLLTTAERAESIAETIVMETNAEMVNIGLRVSVVKASQDDLFLWRQSNVSEDDDRLPRNRWLSRIDFTGRSATPSVIAALPMVSYGCRLMVLEYLTYQMDHGLLIFGNVSPVKRLSSYKKFCQPDDAVPCV